MTRLFPLLLLAACGGEVTVATYNAGLAVNFVPGADERAPATAEAIGGIEADVALQWNDSFNEQIFCYTNNVHNKDGGSHLTGLRAALTKTLNGYASKAGLLKDLKQGLGGDDVREGLRVAWSTPAVRGVLLTSMAMNMLVFPYQQLLPVFVRDEWGQGPLVLGLLGGMDGLMR